MKANNTTAFISGMVVAFSGLYIEGNGYNFAWVAVIFVPFMLIFTIGFEPWRSYLIRDTPSIGWPYDSASWHILLAAWLRMFIFFLGSGAAGLLNALHI